MSGADKPTPLPQHRLAEIAEGLNTPQAIVDFFEGLAQRMRDARVRAIRASQERNGYGLLLAQRDFLRAYNTYIQLTLNHNLLGRVNQFLPQLNNELNGYDGELRLLLAHLQRNQALYSRIPDGSEFPPPPPPPPPPALPPIPEGAGFAGRGYSKLSGKVGKCGMRKGACKCK